MRTRSNPNRQRGAGLIEILVTLIVLMIGLLGLAGVMLQSQRAQIESYERVQALVVLQDMVDRINANRAVVSCYVFTNGADLSSPYLGTAGAAIPVCAAGTATQNARAAADLTQWRDLLLGTAEALGAANVGAVLSARGCVAADPATPNVYLVSVAWQGRDETSAPPAGLPCGKDQYGDEKLRRAIGVRLQLADMT